MEVFKIKKTVAKVELPTGEQIEIRVPSVFECQAAQQKVKEADAIKAIDVLCEFYISLGLTKEQMNYFNAEDFHNFFSFLLGVKKN